MEASIETTRSHRDIQSALRIWPIIKEAIRIPWIRRQHFWPLLALPVALTTLLYLGNYWFLLRDGTRSIGILLQIPNLLVFSFFAVACHRSILIGSIRCLDSESPVGLEENLDSSGGSFSFTSSAGCFGLSPAKLS